MLLSSLVACGLLASTASARTPGLPPEARARDAARTDAASSGPERPDAVPTEPAQGSGLTFIGTTASRWLLSNVVTTSPLVNGQVVGVLGGTNTTTVGAEGAASAEQRLGAFFRFAPPALDGRLALDAAFEIDFGYGDASYGTGGNTGGAFGGDQVNLQTRRLASRVRLARDVDAVVGLQFVADGASDPGASGLDELVRAGGRLLVVGSEAAGASIYGKVRDAAGEERARWRGGVYTLWEQSVGTADDVTLWMADVQIAPAYATRAGVHAWFLQDASGGTAGVLGSGPASALSELQGGPRLPLRATGEAQGMSPHAQVLWLAGDAGYNAGLDRGRVGGSAVFVGNLGIVNGPGVVPMGIQGGLFDAEVRGRWAAGAGSVLRAEVVLATGDGPGEDYYTGVVTANSWGIVGAVATTHGCLLLFPDAHAVNRQVAAVYDVANQGRGLAAMTATAGWDVVPDRWTVSATLGHARNGDGSPAGTEVNVRGSLRPWPFGEVAVQAGTLRGTTLPGPAWLVVSSIEGVVF
jgi:hypothetical protein